MPSLKHHASSQNITAVKELGPWLAREWVTIQVWSTVDAVVKNTVKSQERKNGASNKNYWGTIFYFFLNTWGESNDGLCIC